MKNILWLSRHSANNKQIKELEEVFNDTVDIIKVSATIQTPREVKDLMAKFKCDDVVAVLPLSMLAKMTNIGIRPLRAVMSRELDNQGEPVFHHEYFERIFDVNVVSRSLRSLNNDKRAEVKS